eukprot:9277633-Pyramimonas_sp.AAC.1
MRQASSDAAASGAARGSSGVRGPGRGELLATDGGEGADGHLLVAAAAASPCVRAASGEVGARADRPVELRLRRLWRQARSRASVMPYH